METLYLVIIIASMAVQNILKKVYTEKNKDAGVYTFSFLVTFSAMLFFVFISKHLSMTADLVIYACFFAVSYICATVFTVAAVSCGPLSLTTLIVSYSLMIPTVYGLMFLKDSVGWGFLPGIIMLIISVLMMNIKKGDSDFSFKWIVYAALAFVGNGMCSVVQKMQQITFDGGSKNEFMIMSLGIAAAVLALLVLIKEKNTAVYCVKKSIVSAFGCGIANGAVNLLVMILSAMMPIAIMFPLISAGSIAVTYLVARFCYKEKLTRLQFAGFVIGMISVVFLNI